MKLKALALSAITVSLLGCCQKCIADPSVADPSLQPAPMPGYQQAPGNYPTSAPTGTAGSGYVPSNSKGLLQRFIDAAMPTVTRSKDGSVEVKAPFVNVNVNGGNGVHVTAPFVNVGKDCDSKVSVKAPFVNVGNNGNSNVSVKAPFVDVGKNGDTNVSVKAPFVNVGNNGNSNVSVKAPFVNVGKDGDSNVSVTAPFVNVGKSGDGVSVKAPMVDVNQGTITGPASDGVSSGPSNTPNP